MFSDELKKYDWDDTTARIMSMTAADVDRALAKERLDDQDFMALVSPAAAPFIERMARRSRDVTERRFGKTISMFIPLYITNSCTYSCVYCGFNHHNKFKRVILTPEEIER
ncbi:MAG: 2-iminoacetate synthase ThiH, partial [Candidatus Amulumruptor sp.]|nr:2-iminoacetate synthase ThiH [Candidatus Amulumruptor sp.]